jgi:hypothetical protein
MVMTIFPRVLSHLQQLAGTLLTLLVDTLQYLGLCPRLSASHAAENLSLRRQEKIPLGLSKRTMRRW